MRSEMRVTRLVRSVVSAAMSILTDQGERGAPGLGDEAAVPHGAERALRRRRGDEGSD